MTEKKKVVLLVEKYETFLKSRTDGGKKYTKEIVVFLSDNPDKDPAGWVRARDLRRHTSCKHDQTFFRLLDGLRLEQIIERRGEKRTQHDRPGQDPVYYRISPFFDGSILTQYGKFSHLYYKNIELSKYLEYAKYILAQNGLMPEYEDFIKEDMDTLKKAAKTIKRRGPVTKDETIKIITHNTPAEIKKRKEVGLENPEEMQKRKSVKNRFSYLYPGDSKNNNEWELWQG